MKWKGGSCRVMQEEKDTIPKCFDRWHGGLSGEFSLLFACPKCNKKFMGVIGFNRQPVLEKNGHKHVLTSNKMERRKESQTDGFSFAAELLEGHCATA